MFRDGVREAKATGGLDLVKGDKRGLCRYISSTRKARENVGSLPMGVVKSVEPDSSHRTSGDGYKVKHTKFLFNILKYFFYLQG